MTETLSAAPGMTRDVSAPDVRRRRRISPIWALPIVALLIAGWLGYTAFAERGPTISISFKTAAGIEPGKTRIKYHDIVLGIVERVTPTDDLSHVRVSAKMNRMAERHLTKGTKFWVVRPRFGLTGLSGLETLVSGAYIEMDPGEGKATHSFEGLEEPPVIRADIAGREFVLTTKKLGAIGTGSPIFFHGLQVGEVASHTFSEADASSSIRIFIREPFDAFVYDQTRFWNASGITFSAGGSGFKLQIESLQAVLLGGLAFDTDDNVRSKTPSKEGAVFPLYDDQASARDAAYTKTSRAIVEFSGSVRGLEKGAPVEFRGLRIGEVLDFYLEFDPATKALRVPVTIELDIERVRLTSGTYESYGRGALLSDFVDRGLRAQLRTASLITGQLMVSLDFFPDAPPAEVVFTDTYPKLPTMPNTLENIERSLGKTLDRIASLPLDELVQDIRKVLGSVLALTDSSELKDSIRSLNNTLASTETLMQNANSQVGPLIVSLRRASDSADAAMKQADGLLASANAGYGRDSKVRGDLTELLRQLQDAAKSVRNLASYLEQHPESLLRGK